MRKLLKHMCASSPSALTAGSRPDGRALTPLLLLLVRDSVTAVMWCAHDPVTAHLLITVFLPSGIYVYLQPQSWFMLTCLSRPVGFYLGGSLTKILMKRWWGVSGLDGLRVEKWISVFCSRSVIFQKLLACPICPGLCMYTQGGIGQNHRNWAEKSGISAGQCKSLAVSRVRSNNGIFVA